MKALPVYKSEEGEKAILAAYDNLLKTWPVPKADRFVETKYGKTFVIESGMENGQALVLLHGSGSNALAWGHDVIEYSKKFRVFTIDIPGDPGKSEPVRTELAGDRICEWLDETLDGLALEKVIVAGVSLGGCIALKYAAYRPERVAKLCLVSSSGIYPLRASYLWKIIGYSFLGERGKQKIKRMFFGDAQLPGEAETFFGLCEKELNYRPDTPPVLSDAELKKLSMDVLYVAGRKDEILDSEKSAQRLKDILPNAKTVILEGTGHMVTCSQNYIMQFLG
jgi:pimeloyl-ACP methyl ester carboxylesterase